ncbi:MAG: hypothetical protein WCO38_06975 [Verrucomicrobiota bacterium]|jgi:hypothetical protein|nr:MAG: hypothetical protein DVB35_04115 [Verrucomicrobiota bacterium]
MNKRICFIFSALLLVAGIARATPVMQTTAIMSKPDSSSAPLGVVTAGTEPEAAIGETAPEGWLAVKVAGPFDLYIENKDLSKGLDPKAGSPLRLEPKPEAPVVIISQKGDPLTITGLRGKWTRLKLTKDLVGYIQTTVPANTSAPQTGVIAVATQVPVSIAPGKAADSSATDSKAAQPRYFEGKMVSSHHTFTLRNSIFAWEIQDSTGARIAYLDLEKIMQTEQIESYVDHQIQVYGIPRLEVGSDAIVVSVESLQAK